MKSPTLGLYRGIGITTCLLLGYVVSIEQSHSGDTGHYSAGAIEDTTAFFAFIDDHIDVTCEDEAKKDEPAMLFCTQGVGTNCPKGRPPLQKLSSKGSENPVYAGPYESGPIVIIDGVSYLDDMSRRDNSHCKGIKIMKEKMGVDESIYKSMTPEEVQALSDKNIAGMQREEEERAALQKRIADNKAAKKSQQAATTQVGNNSGSSRTSDSSTQTTTANLIKTYEQKTGILLTPEQMSELQTMYKVAASSQDSSPSPVPTNSSSPTTVSEPQAPTTRVLKR